MSVSESREVVIEATPESILDVLYDLGSLPEWSSAHQSVQVLERDADGHASRSKQVVKIVGISDEQELAYRVHADGVSWSLIHAQQQRAQNGRYILTPEGDVTRVRFDLEVELSVPVPGFLVKRATKGLMETATEGLRKRVLTVAQS